MIKRQKKSDWRLLGYVPTWIVGIQYASADIEPDAQVYLEPEPDNPVDSLAMKVVNRRGMKAGYLPRYDAALFTPAVNGGHILLKGVAGNDDDCSGYRIALRLEVYASSKADCWFETQTGDNLQDIIHNNLLSVWLNIEYYSATTLMAFRDMMREHSRNGNMRFETGIIYRLLRGRMVDKREAEKENSREAVAAALNSMVVAAPAGYPELTAVALFKPGTILCSPQEKSALTSTLSVLPEDIVEAYPFPSGACGVALFSGKILRRVCFYGSSARLEINWFSLISEEIEQIASGWQRTDIQPAITPDEAKSRLLMLLNCSQIETGATDENRERRLTFRDGFCGQAVIDSMRQVIFLDLRYGMSIDN